MMTQSEMSINHPLSCKFDGKSVATTTNLINHPPSCKLDGKSVATTTNLPTISMAMADQHHDKQGMVTSHRLQKDFTVELNLIYNKLYIKFNFGILFSQGTNNPMFFFYNEIDIKINFICKMLSKASTVVKMHDCNHSAVLQAAYTSCVVLK